MYRDNKNGAGANFSSAFKDSCTVNW